MTILPKNRSLSNADYNKDKKNIIAKTQSMLDTELFFKMKQQELLSKIEKQELLEEHPVRKFDPNVPVKKKKKSEKSTNIM